MTRKEKMATERAGNRAPRAAAMRPAMTPRPPVPAAAHSAKVTTGVDGCSENHHGGPAAGRGMWMTAMLGPAASTAIMMMTEMTIRIAAAPTRTARSRSRGGLTGLRSVAPVTGLSSVPPAAGAGGAWLAGCSPVTGEAANHESRGEAVPGVPGYAGRRGSLSRPELLTNVCLPKVRSPATACRAGPTARGLPRRVRRLPGVRTLSKLPDLPGQTVPGHGKTGARAVGAGHPRRDPRPRCRPPWRVPRLAYTK